MSKHIVRVILVLSIILGNLYKFSFFSPDVRISLLDIAVLGLVIYKFPQPKKIASSLIRPLFIFFIVACASLLWALVSFNYTDVAVGVMYLVRWLVYAFAFASLIQIYEAPDLKKLLVSMGLSVVLTGIFQYILWPDIRHLQVAEWDPHYYRVVGSFLDPGFIGILLVFTLLFLTINKLKNKYFQYFFWALSYLTFALTYSRSSYLAFIAGMAYVSWKRKGWKFFAFILLLFVVTVTILPRNPDGEGVKLERTSSIEARITNWKNSLEIFSDYPVLGVGFNVYRYAQNRYGFLGESKWLQSHAGAGADSSLLFVTATTGIVGLLAYLWYWKNLILLSNLTTKSVIVSLFIHSLFLNSLFYPFVMLWVAVFIAWSLQSVPFESDSPNDQLL